MLKSTIFVLLAAAVIVPNTEAFRFVLIYPRICYLPKVSGTCLAAIPKWTFNANTGVCEPFTYGGCGGNANNFETQEECLNACPRRARIGIVFW